MSNTAMQDRTIGERSESGARHFRAPTRLERAVDDLASGTARWWMWSSMAWQDIRQRYRGSILGPFWLTLSMAIMIFSLGFLYSSLFKTNIHEYLPFLCLGLLVWTFISTTITEGCSTFIAAESIIRQVKMPFSVHVYRILWRNLIVLAHNAVVYVAVVFLFGVPTTPYALMALPGLAVLVLNGVWVCILLGMICARYRDVVPIVASLLQILFFVTPILWDPSLVTGRLAFLLLNPVYAMIEAVRAPLLNHPMPEFSWPLVLGTTLVGWAVTFLFFVRFRSRIPFWV